jgi:hypothetical protein
LPVRWAWYRPEVRVGDTVRLLDASAGHSGWHSFRVVGKRITDDDALVREADAAASSPGWAIHLDVEPLALQD